MALSTLEEDVLGVSPTPVERVLAGVPVALGAAGHLLLVTAAALFLYVLVTAGA